MSKGLKTVTLPRGYDGLHIEAPGCIINIETQLQIEGKPATYISINANGDRLAGEPAWWALPGRVESAGVGVRIVQGIPEPKLTRIPVRAEDSIKLARLSGHMNELDRLTRSIDLGVHPDARNLVAAMVSVIRLAMADQPTGDQDRQGPPEPPPSDTTIGCPEPLAPAGTLAHALREVMGWYDSGTVALAMSKWGQQAEYHRTLRLARAALKGR